VEASLESRIVLVGLGAGQESREKTLKLALARGFVSKLYDSNEGACNE
jgi:hypothetical protein